MAVILNNLNYDTEDFDFMPHDGHMDTRGMGAMVGVAGMPGSSSGAEATSTGSAGMSGVSTVVDPQATAAGLHNLSGSTRSDVTHPGASPSSISNYSLTPAVGMMAAGYMSPSHKMALGLNPMMVAGFSAVSSVPALTSVTQAASVAGCDYPSSVFDSYTPPTAAMSGLSCPISGTAPPNYQQD